MRVTVLLSLLLLTLSANARAFTHVVQPGETLAALAERFYGKIQNENLLVVANGLDAQGGIAIVPGMRLEVPAVTYVVVTEKRTWKELAQQYLGGEHRAFVLAEANNSKAWLPPDPGAEVIVPYNLRFVATGNETIVGLAYRFLGDRKLAWSLDQYNARGGRRLERGEVVMLPIVSVALTKDGKVAARKSIDLANQQTLGAAREAQDLVERGLPELSADVQRARYVDAVQRGTRFLESGALSRVQLARIQRLLLEAYAALGAKERAAESCAAWFQVDNKAQLDPVMMSPKLITACESAGVKGSAKGTDLKPAAASLGTASPAAVKSAPPAERKSP
jgi:hypothetical protein